MNVRCGAPVLMAAAALVTGACRPGEPALTPLQWEAAETRSIEAAPGTAYRCVAETMLDKGYVILVSDSAAGLIRGARLAAPSYQSGASAPAFGTLWPGEIVVYVRAEGPARSRVRTQMWERGMRVADEQRAKEWAADVQNRALGIGRPLARPGGAP